MSAGIYNILLEQGATYSDGIRVRYQDGLVMDISAYHIRMQIRSAIGGIQLIALETGDFTHQNLAQGYFVIYIGATVTALFPVGRYFYDLELTNSGNPDDVIRLLEGEVNVRGEVTT